MQRQPARTPEQGQQRPPSANRPDVQNSRRNSRDQQAPASQAVQPSSSNGAASSEQMGYGQMSGSFNGGQTGAGQLAAALSSSALLQNASGMQLPYPAQGAPSMTHFTLSGSRTGLAFLIVLRMFTALELQASHTIYQWSSLAHMSSFHKQEMDALHRRYPPDGLK